MGGFTNKYEKIKDLNIGEKSIVYLVNNNEDKNNYVIKQYKIQSLKPEELKKIKIDCKNLSLINNRNIIKYSEINEEDKKNKYFSIVVEYCENGDLKNFIEKHKNNNNPIDINLIYLIILDICFGIKELHKNNITHEDINPERMFIGNDYRIKIGGPGISKYLTKNASSGNYVTQYTSPDLLKGNENNKANDIWSLGSIIYELCTLNKCFNGNNVFDLFKSISECIYDKNKLNKCNKELNDLIDLCLQKDCNKRPTIDLICKIIIDLLAKFELPKSIINDVDLKI